MGSNGRDGSEHGQYDDETEVSTHLKLVVIEGVPETLVEIGLEYWQLTAVDEMGTPRWSCSTSEIDTAGLGAIHHVAAASVRALVPGKTCIRCGNQLAARTRSDFAKALAGDSVTCVSCDPKYMELAAKVIASYGGDRHQKLLTNRARRDAEQAWNASKRYLVETHHAVTLKPDVPLPGTRVDLAVKLLSILRHGRVDPSLPGVITPIGQWQQPPLTAARETQKLVNEIHLADLTYIHPASELRAFVFEPKTFDDALQAADGLVDDVEPPQLANSYYPLSSHFYIPYGSSPGVAAQRMSEHLSRRLQLAALDQKDRLQLLALVADTIADEAVRYFNYQVELMSLPEVPEQHRARLRDAAHKAASYMSLGRLYNQAWRATRMAATQAQSLRLPNSPKMTTYAVNTFEQRAGTRANGTDAKVYDELAQLPLAAVTRTLFRTVFDANPLDFTVDQAHARLANVPLPDDGSWSWPAAAVEVAKSIELGTWNGAEIRAELAKMQASWNRLRALSTQAQLAEKFAAHYDLYVVGTDAQRAAAATIELAELTARARTDNAAGAQAILLWWADCLASRRETVTAQDRAATNDGGDASETSSLDDEDDVSATAQQLRQAQRSNTPKKLRNNRSRKKKRRR